MARRSRRSTPSGWPYLGVGLALGLAVAAGVYFSDLRSGAGVPSASAARAAPPSRAPESTSQGRSVSGRGAADRAAQREPSTEEPADEADAVGSGGVEPSFDFYEILPQYEVLVPEEVQTLARPAPPAAPVAAPGSYVLQTGSFRSHTDADRMQASLALLGVESSIQKVAIDAGEFHRVRIGPISNLDELNRIRGVLGQAGVESLMMKVGE